MKRVDSKAEFFRLSQNFEFGNRLRQWNWQEFLSLLNNGGAPPAVSVRNTGVPGQMKMQRYRMPPCEAYEHCQGLIRAGYAVDSLLLDESAPDDCVTLQCEVMNSSRFIELRYALNAHGMGMRQAYEIMSHAWGSRALTILRRHLDASSQDNLFRILEEYGDSCVELSAYSIPVGVLGWNTIFWEVRNF
jgi:hypothetical protein